MEKRYFHKNGSVVWINLSVSSMCKFGEVVKRFSNITKLAKKEYADGLEMVCLEKSEYKEN